MVDLALRRPPTTPQAEWLKVLPPASRWILHGGAPARALAAPVWGVDFSDIACRATVAGARAALWLGPDEYLLLELPAGETTMAGALESALGTEPHALVDVSHRQFAFEVSGPHSSTLLSAACPLDLHPGAFPVGMCTRTVLAKADIVLWRTRADAFHVEAWRSFAGYVGGLLVEIGREFYP
jgi:sarcosine oxidase subunit gamma